MESMVNLIVSLISGIVGGNIAGAAMPDKSLGALGNSVAGFFGGGIGGYILQAIGLFSSVAGAGQATTGLDIGQILGNIGGSGVGGAVLMIVVGLIKNAMQKNS